VEELDKRRIAKVLAKQPTPEADHPGPTSIGSNGRTRDDQNQAEYGRSPQVAASEGHGTLD
jgi:hypothetical protein